ncbi:MAG: helix-turn-helix domain-containing protein [Clostridiaceae bacterium]|nr:helix-turn-helix domain-containing protein [Clostridiaceae bacterium]
MEIKINSNRLRGLRVENELNQKQVAAYLGISGTAYRNKESNRSEFTLSEARKIALKFGQPIESIFYGERVAEGKESYMGWR